MRGLAHERNLVFMSFAGVKIQSCAYTVVCTSANNGVYEIYLPDPSIEGSPTLRRAAGARYRALPLEERIEESEQRVW